MRYIVEGVSRTTRADVRILVDAASEEAARIKAEIEIPEVVVARVLQCAESQLQNADLRHKRYPRRRDNLLATSTGYRSSRGLLVTVTVAGIIKSVASIIVLVAVVDELNSYFPDEEVLTAMAALEIVTGLLYIIPFLMLMHRLWSSVPPPFASTSPGRAVGFMFIPLFNIYWVFRLLVGLASDLRTALRHHAIELPTGRGVAIAGAIVAAIVMVPCSYGGGLGLLVPPAIALQVIFVWIVLGTLERVPAEVAVSEESL